MAIQLNVIRFAEYEILARSAKRKQISYLIPCIASVTSGFPECRAASALSFRYITYNSSEIAFHCLFRRAPAWGVGGGGGGDAVPRRATWQERGRSFGSAVN